MAQSRDRLDELVRALRAMDIDFCLLRERIAEEFRARQTGHPPANWGFLRTGNWDEGAFWSAFKRAMRRGEFDPFIYRTGPEQIACFWADCFEHTRAGRFDHLIRAWARA